jgi:hypothetical protein
MSAHAAALAVIQVGHKLSLFLVDATLGTIDLAEAAFYAFLLIEYGHESPPGTGLRCTGAARIYQSPCLYFHQITLS